MAGDTEYKREWTKEHLDRINLTVPKGEKAAIKAHADAHGESLNQFINRAIREAMERDRELADGKTEAAPVDEHEIAVENHTELKESTETSVPSSPVVNTTDVTFPLEPKRSGRKRLITVVEPDSGRTKK